MFFCILDQIYSLGENKKKKMFLLIW